MKNLSNRIEEARNMERTYFIYTGEEEPSKEEKEIINKENCKLEKIGKNLWKIVL